MCECILFTEVVESPIFINNKLVKFYTQDASVICISHFIIMLVANIPSRNILIFLVRWMKKLS